MEVKRLSSIANWFQDSEQKEVDKLRNR